MSATDALIAFHEASMPWLRTLRITPSFSKLADIEPLFFVARSSSVEYLDLSDNAFTVEMMHRLVAVIKHGQLPRLKSLKLSRSV